MEAKEAEKMKYILAGKVAKKNKPIWETKER